MPEHTAARTGKNRHPIVAGHAAAPAQEGGRGTQTVKTTIKRLRLDEVWHPRIGAPRGNRNAAKHDGHEILRRVRAMVRDYRARARILRQAAEVSADEWSNPNGERRPLPPRLPQNIRQYSAVLKTSDFIGGAPVRVMDHRDDLHPRLDLAGKAEARLRQHRHRRPEASAGRMTYVWRPSRNAVLTRHDLHGRQRLGAAQAGSGR